MESLVWKLTLEGTSSEEDDDLELQFIDTSNILGEPTIERQFIDTIINRAKKLEHYSIFRNLKRIISDKGEDMTGSAIWVLLGVVPCRKSPAEIFACARQGGIVNAVDGFPRVNFQVEEHFLAARLVEEVFHVPPPKGLVAALRRGVDGARSGHRSGAEKGDQALGVEDRRGGL